jgi:hypothetical protein
LGFLLAFTAGWWYASAAQDEEWRIIFGWAGVGAMIQFAGMWGMPESPVWLAEQGRFEESQKAWQRIHGGGGRREPITTTSRRSSLSSEEQQQQQRQQQQQHGIIEMGEIPSPPQLSQKHHWHARSKYEPISSTAAATTTTTAATTTTTTTETSLRSDSTGENNMESSAQISLNATCMAPDDATFTSTISRFRRQVYITIFLAVTQQLCGQTSVLNYAPIIFADAAGQDEAPGWSTVAIGGCKFVVTLLVIWRIEFLGRRFLLLFGMTVIALGQLCLIVAFGGYQNKDSWSTDQSGFELALPGVLMVVCGYSMSFGPLTWLLTSELFPTDIRGRALGASTIVTYLCASLVTRTFLSAQTWWGPSKVFAIYCIATSMGIVFAYLAIPDTGGKTVDQVEVALHGMWWWRFDRVALSEPEDEDGPTATGPYSLHNNSPITHQDHAETDRPLPQLT